MAEMRDRRALEEARAKTADAKRKLPYHHVTDLPPMLKPLTNSPNPKTQYYANVTLKGASLMTVLTKIGTHMAKDKAVDKWQFSRPLSAAARLVRKVPLLGNAVVGPEPVQSSNATPTNLRDAYAPMFNHRPDEWKQIPYGGETYTDEAFADQQLNGCQPYFIRRVDGDVAALQEKIRVTDAHAAAVVGRGTTLANLIKDDRLFIIDTSPYFEGLWGNPSLQGVCNAVPVALFYIDTAKGRLMPLAIQLLAGAGRAGHANPVFTPKDDASVWLAAKMFVNNALVCAHVACLHFAGGKAARAMAIAIKRCLPDDHSVADLTYGFSDYSVACSMLEPVITNPPKWLDNMTKVSWRSFNMDYWHVRDDIKARGVEGIPHYHWRDEALALFDVFEALVQRVVDDAYATDDDVARDAFLSDLVEELHHEVNVRGTVINRTVSGRFETKANVVRFFAAYCCFSAPGFSYDAQQWPWYVWTPATPLNFTLTPMTTKEPIEFEKILAALDQPFSDAVISQRAGIMAVLAYTDFSRLTTGGPHGHRVPHLPKWLTATPGRVAAREQFYVALAELEAAMRERDVERVKRGQRAFTALYPKKQMCSIWY